jgi:hypothetical protein
MVINDTTYAVGDPAFGRAVLFLLLCFGFLGVREEKKKKKMFFVLPPPPPQKNRNTDEAAAG